MTNLSFCQAAIGPKTKVIILNSPHNPTGKIFSREEMSQIAEICRKFDHLTVISDEVYEHIIFEGMSTSNLFLFRFFLPRCFSQRLCQVNISVLLVSPECGRRPSLYPHLVKRSAIQVGKQDGLLVHPILLRLYQLCSNGYVKIFNNKLLVSIEHFLT